MLSASQGFPVHLVPPGGRPPGPGRCSKQASRVSKRRSVSELCAASQRKTSVWAQGLRVGAKTEIQSTGLGEAEEISCLKQMGLQCSDGLGANGVNTGRVTCLPCGRLLSLSRKKRQHKNRPISKLPQKKDPSLRVYGLSIWRVPPRAQAGWTFKHLTVLLTLSNAYHKVIARNVNKNMH